jgi:hypothetical protein
MAIELYLAAKNHREFWVGVYNAYARDPQKAKSVALARQLRVVIAELKKLEAMG